MRRCTRLAVSVLPVALAAACADPPIAPTAARAPASVHSQITPIAGASVTTPGRPVIFELSETETYVLVPLRDPGAGHVYLLDRVTGTLTFQYAVGTGGQPLVMSRGRGSDILVANSSSHDISVLRPDAQRRFYEWDRFGSGGVAPADVQLVFPDLIIVANRGALTGEGEGVSFFATAKGATTQIGGLLSTGPQPSPFPTGNDPHIIVVGTRGVVGVANSNSNDVTILDVDRSGTASVLLQSLPVGASPKALAFTGHNILHVLTRTLVFGASQDQIKTYAIHADGSFDALGAVNAGYFATGLAARDGKLFVPTWSNPTTPTNQLSVYDVAERGPPIFLESINLPGSPSFQQVAVSSVFQDLSRLVAVTQFQSNSINVAGFYTP